MSRFPVSRLCIAFTVATGLVTWSGCKTQRVYLDDKPTWIQQATGEVDISSPFGSEVAERQTDDRDAEPAPTSRQTHSSESTGGPPEVEFGPREVTVTVEGEDY